MVNWYLIVANINIEVIEIMDKKSKDSKKEEVATEERSRAWPKADNQLQK